MKKFAITVGALSYEGLFASSCDAIIDALDRFPEARKVSAKCLES